ncbi:MAG: permease, partial [Gammaproteobacteria bacterium]|nr:permease [Gammaproteobacteria bacterium]
FIPPDWLAQWGGGLTAMLVMLVVGVPMYICAVASTPVAAGLLLAGVSPGAVLVFLLVGPATNIASFALIKQELGLRVTVMYLLGLSLFSLMMGLLLEWLIKLQGWQVEASLGHAHAMLPDAVSWASAFILILLAIKPLRRALFPQLG